MQNSDGAKGCPNTIQWRRWELSELCSVVEAQKKTQKIAERQNQRKGKLEERKMIMIMDGERGKRYGELGKVEKRLGIME